MPHSFHRNFAAAHLFLSELVANGVSLFVVAPGSRSGPLLTALSQLKVRTLVHYDERGAAFLALGYGKATGTPGCLITTSGTAVANCLPAVVESSESHAPLLLVTADRPPELLQRGANQTTDQRRLFGRFLVGEWELPCSDPAFPLRAVQTTADAACSSACFPIPGPVHINCSFRDPLGLSAKAFQEFSKSTPPDRSQKPPYRRECPVRTAPPDPEGLAFLAEKIRKKKRGLLVIGEIPAKDREALLTLSQALPFPILPDGLSISASPLPAQKALSCFDLLLSSLPWQKMGEPDIIFQVGSRLTSRPLLEYLKKKSSLHTFSLTPYRPLDPLHRVRFSLSGDLTAACHFLARSPLPLTPERASWLSSWKEADSAVKKVLRRTLRRASFSELHIPLSLQALSPKTALFVGNSLPIRLLTGWGGAEKFAAVGSNRGVSGIDGTVSSAAGFAEGLTLPTCCFLGDQALLHDLNSLPLLAKIGAPLLLLVSNNGGGGIFSHLPVGASPELDPLFAAPHPYHFREVASGFGIAYAAPTSFEELQSLLQKFLQKGEPALIEVVSSRKKNYSLFQTVRKNAARSLSSLQNEGGSHVSVSVAKSRRVGV